MWEPLPLPSPAHRPGENAGLETAAEALVELLSALARRQHEHRIHTVSRLGAVIGSGLLPADLAEMALYYQAKAQRDLGHSAVSRQGMQAVADGGGRLAPATRRGLAHLARLAGDFPTALTTAEALGREGRGRRVLGDIWWAHARAGRAAAAYEAARAEAEEDGNAGERAIGQAHRALALAFTDPAQAGDEILFAEQLLSGLDQRATTLTTKIAVLVWDAGTDDTDFDDRADLMRAEITVPASPLPRCSSPSPSNTPSPGTPTRSPRTSTASGCSLWVATTSWLYSLVVGSGTDLGESSRSVTLVFDCEETGSCETAYALSSHGQN
ncbi:hypothetical protein [Streptomyces sp. NPDC048269]|uniref:hypothetical protein n=1 Tax=Streptomyces sp. NPDC048269 TaxID=3155753 RepID=UPI003413F105